MFKHLNNDRGAALLLTLFLVMFISIVGAALLNTTFYGKKNNVAAVAEQQEFYPLEGAIEMMLFEMNAYNKQDAREFLMSRDAEGNERRVLDGSGNPIQIVNKGAYFYVNDPSSPKTKIYKIGGMDIQVRVDKDLNAPNRFFLTASKLTDNKLVRVITIELKKGGEPPILEFDPEVPEVAPFPKGPFLGYTHVNINPNQMENVGKLSERFENILRFYGLNQGGSNQTLRQSYSFAGKDKHYFSDIALSGRTPLVIPAGNLVYVDKIDLTGGQITINGILLANDFDVRGNLNLQINGAVIANRLSVRSNAVTIGSNAGVDPGGSGGGYQAPSREITEKDFTRSSEVKILDMDTRRK